jgi:hypothetical protein
MCGLWVFRTNSLAESIEFCMPITCEYHSKATKHRSTFSGDQKICFTAIFSTVFWPQHYIRWAWGGYFKVREALSSSWLHATESFLTSQIQLSWLWRKHASSSRLCFVEQMESRETELCHCLSRMAITACANDIVTCFCSSKIIQKSVSCSHLQ